MRAKLVVMQFPFIFSFESATDSKNDSSDSTSSLILKKKDFLHKGEEEMQGKMKMNSQKDKNLKHVHRFYLKKKKYHHDSSC